MVGDFPLVGIAGPLGSLRLTTYMRSRELRAQVARALGLPDLPAARSLLGDTNRLDEENFVRILLQRGQSLALGLGAAPPSSALRDDAFSPANDEQPQ